MEGREENGELGDWKGTGRTYGCWLGLEEEGGVVQPGLRGGEVWHFVGVGFLKFWGESETEGGLSAGPFQVAGLD